MPELIDRHALLKKVYEHTQERERMTDGEWCRKCIYEAPKAEPVRHGQWVMLEEYSLHGEKYADYACQYCEHRISRAKGFCPNFCEDCGAKMDGGAENG